MHDVHIGVDIWPQHISATDLTRAWQQIDSAGIHNLWVCDHFEAFRGDRKPSGDILEAWSCLAAAAAITSNVRLGVMVTGNTYRHPAVLAKIATTVDHLSAGRLEFGIGASDAPTEHQMFGMEFPDGPVRLRMLRESCELIKMLWTEDRSTFDGDYYSLQNAVSDPAPFQKPYPPFWIGGEGEKVTLRIVAEHADVWNAIGRRTVDEYRHKLRVLDAHCERVGRDPKTLRRSVQVHFEEESSTDEVIRRIDELINAGFSEFVIIVPPPDVTSRISKIAEEVCPRFHGVSVEV